MFEREFSDKRITIHNKSWFKIPKLVGNGFRALRNWYSPENADDITDINFEYQDAVEISDFSNALNTLKYFGKFISKLHLMLNDADSYQGKEISRYVEKYCSESVSELHLFSESGTPLKYWTKPFPNVQRLHFHHMTVNDLTKKNRIFLRNAPPMNKTFPGLRSFAVRSFVDTDYLDCHFPKLEQLDVTAGVHGVEKSAIFKLLEANPQIRSVSLSSEDCEVMLKKLNVALSGLEDLSIFCPSDIFQGSSILTFENVKNFEILNYFNPPTNIRLPRLQQLKIKRIDHSYTVQWIKFLHINHNVRKISLKNAQINNNDIIRLTENLQNLEEISVSQEIKKKRFFRRNTDALTIDTVDSFLNDSRQLEKFEFNFCTQKDQEILRERHQMNWIISDYENGLCFQKFNTN